MKKIEERRYQTRAAEAFPEWIQSSDPLGTIILPTGTGKTYTAARCLSSTNKRVLWTAHREELIDQAHEALALVMPDRNISIEMAERKADPLSDVVVGSVQTLARSRKHLDGFEPDIIVIDEYHHYAESNIQYDGLLKRWPNAKILGLTATPWRGSGETLPLGRVLIQMDIGTAIDKKYLVPIKPESLITKVSLADVKTRMGDFAIKDLSKAVNVDSRNQLIAKRLIELVRDGKRQGILFAVDVEHSKAMCELLKKEVRCAEVYGETPTEERRAIMSKIRNGEIDVLCNNLVATEGFDVRHLSFVCIGRPTKSLGLYIQMAGRGLRVSPETNKEDCVVVDVHDKVKVKQTRITFLDMAEAGDIFGEKKRAINVLKAEVPLEPLTDKLINFPIVIKKHQVERWVVDDDTFSISSWALGSDQWIVTWTAEVKQPKIISKAVFVPWTELPPPEVQIAGRSVSHDTFGIGKVASITDRVNPKIAVDFGWEQKIIEMTHLKVQKFVKEYSPSEIESVKTDKLFYICMPEVEPRGRIICFTKDSRDLCLKDDRRLDRFEAEAFLQEEAMKDGVLQLVRTNAKWKAGPASPKQRDFVQKMMSRIGFDIDLDSLTKGDASAIIDQAKWQEIIQRKFGTDYKEKLLGYDPDLHDV